MPLVRFRHDGRPTLGVLRHAAVEVDGVGTLVNPVIRVGSPAPADL
jgi:hypothetical protein